jgi:uncharacterized protein YdhG (YjbR/CyaY superfamily)
VLAASAMSPVRLTRHERSNNRRGAPMTKLNTIDEYVDSLPVAVRPAIEAIRETVRSAAPDAVEAISYQMPCFKWRGKYLIHFGAWKNHIGVYPIPAGTPAFQKKVAPYLAGKGTVRFPLRDPIPLDIVRDMVTLRMKEISAS